MSVHQPFVSSSSDSPGAAPVLDSPYTPDTQHGSLRSILRDGQAPATGRSVRFIPRDDYKVTSPDNSNDAGSVTLLIASAQAQNTSGSTRLPSDTIPPRLRSPRTSVRDVFPYIGHSPGSPLLGSLSLGETAAPPSLSNIFDLTADYEIPTISHATSMQDNAVEVTDSDHESRHHHAQSKRPASATLMGKPPLVFAPSMGNRSHSTPSTQEQLPVSSSKPHNRSQSFSFGQTVFFSMNKSTLPEQSAARTRSTSSVDSPSKKQSTLEAFSPIPPHSQTRTPEADINDPSSLEIFSLSAPEPDPFGADARTYYTPESLIVQTPHELQIGGYFPPTPNGQPDRVVGNPATKRNDLRGPSIGEGVVNSLRTQLALQHELCKQYAVDLSSRDEMVNKLRDKLDASIQDAENRKTAVHGWRKKVAELERACRYLEEHADRSLHNSTERSVLEEASGEALRMLHVRINALEKEKRETRANADILHAQLAERDEQEQKLRADFSYAHAQLELMTDDGGTRRLPGMSEHTTASGQHVYRETIARGEEQMKLQSRISELEKIADELVEEKMTLQQQLRDVAPSLAHQEEQLTILKAELEAQWKNTEQSSATIHGLRQERQLLLEQKDALRQDLDSLEAKVNVMELDWIGSENKKAELEENLRDAWAAREKAERERDTVGSFYSTTPSVAKTSIS
jgi:hypothetical protein